MVEAILKISCTVGGTGETSRKEAQIELVNLVEHDLPDDTVLRFADGFWVSLSAEELRRALRALDEAHDRN